MYYRQPRYYSTFQCIGSDCPDNCCFGWAIDWKKEEIEKLKNAENITPELKELVEKSFVIKKAKDNDGDQYIINQGEEKKCPFQTPERLCRIQKELGAEYLSYTCMHYPRRERTIPDFEYRHMHLSCREIISRLFDDELACDLINIRSNNEFSCRRGYFTHRTLQKRPEIEHYGVIFEFFYELISDKKLSVEVAIIFGALAAQKLTDLAANKQYDRIPEALKAFRKQFHDPAQISMLENIKPNYYLKLGFMSELIEKVIRGGLAPLLHDSTGTLNIDLYNEGEKKLQEALKGHEFFLRNLALGLLFEFDTPFCNEKNTMFENYSLFTVAYGLLKLNLIATCRTDDHDIKYGTDGQTFVYSGDDKLIGITAIICRSICQDRGKEEFITELLRTFNFTTPAYLALLVK